jgi:hypothetical protein
MSSARKYLMDFTSNGTRSSNAEMCLFAFMYLDFWLIISIIRGYRRVVVPPPSSFDEETSPDLNMTATIRILLKGRKPVTASSAENMAFISEFGEYFADPYCSYS